MLSSSSYHTRTMNQSVCTQIATAAGCRHPHRTPSTNRNTQTHALTRTSATFRSSMFIKIDVHVTAIVIIYVPTLSSLSSSTQPASLCGNGLHNFRVHVHTMFAYYTLLCATRSYIYRYGTALENVNVSLSDTDSRTNVHNFETIFDTAVHMRAPLLFIHSNSRSQTRFGESTATAISTSTSTTKENEHLAVENKNPGTCRRVVLCAIVHILMEPYCSTSFACVDVCLSGVERSKYQPVFESALAAPFFGAKTAAVAAAEPHGTSGKATTPCDVYFPFELNRVSVLAEQTLCYFPSYRYLRPVLSNGIIKLRNYSAAKNRTN